MRKLQITFEIPEDYDDVCPELLIADMHIDPYWVISDWVDIVPTTGHQQEVLQREPGTKVLINFNDEAGVDQYSV